MLILLFSLLSRSLIGQEMNGFVHSNYAGITGAQINPSSIVSSKLYLDINTLGLHLFADNNWLYLAKEDFSFARFFDFEFVEHPINPAVPDSRTRAFYDNMDQEVKNGYASLKVLGPSFMYSKNDRAFGISTSFRNIFSADKVPYDIAKFVLESFHYPRQQNTQYDNQRDFRVGGASFVEISASYAQVIYKHNRNHLSAGITLKGLLSFGGGYWHVENVRYMVEDAYTLIVDNANGSAGVSLPVNYAVDMNDDNFITSPSILGKGLGFDLGITYQVKLEGHSNTSYGIACEQAFEPYLFKLGFSLIDIGYIKYNKNTRFVELVDAQARWEGFVDEPLDNIDYVLTRVDQEINPSNVTRDPFRVFLPAAASAQLDIRMNKDFYVNSSWIQPLVLSPSTIVRPSQFSITPRYESKDFEVAVPLTLYEYRYPRIGLSMRLANLVIGTDKLGGFFGMNHFTGMDLYVMVKLPFHKGDCKNINGIECSNFEFRKFKRSTKRLR